MRRVLGTVTVAAGVAALSAASVVHWVLVPRLAQLPGNFSTLRVYTGTAAMVANPTYLTAVPMGPGILRDMPITVRHATRVLQTHGTQALVSDERAIDIPGYNVADVTYWFDINRKTFERAHYAGWREDAVPSQGVTFNWPMSSKPQDYRAWVPDTQQTVIAHYAGTVPRGGITTYKFTVNVPQARITDPQVLRILPASMTKQQLMKVTPSLELPMKRLLALNKLLSRLPDPVPLAYTYRSNSTFWVAPATGIVVDLRSHEVRTLNFVDASRLVPINPVMNMTYSAPPGTLHAAVSDAKSGAHQLKLLRTTLPWSLLAVGVVLLVVGLVLAAPRKRHSISDVDLAALMADSAEEPASRV